MILTLNKPAKATVIQHYFCFLICYAQSVSEPVLCIFIRHAFCMQTWSIFNTQLTKLFVGFFDTNYLGSYSTVRKIRGGGINAGVEPFIDWTQSKNGTRQFVTVAKQVEASKRLQKARGWVDDKWLTCKIYKKPVICFSGRHCIINGIF